MNIQCFPLEKLPTSIYVQLLSIRIGATIYHYNNYITKDINIQLFRGEGRAGGGGGILSGRAKDDGGGLLLGYKHHIVYFLRTSDSLHGRGAAARLVENLRHEGVH